ncbi:Constitutive coactivator of peroxisome proliferator-activated receptor gamma, partial [Stegodyphus mimosarum]
MGVKGLQYYIEQQCPDACRYVSIAELAEEHKNRYNCQPVLVVDGMALIYPLYSTTLEWVFGGQWVQFVRKLENFMKRFSEIGVKLVFFFDGTVCSRKRKEWVKRRISKYKQISSIFNGIKANHSQPDKKLFQLPSSMGTLTRFALKELGAEVYQTDTEADDVIAEYAATNNAAFAILSQDSDFIIYNTKPYLSLSHLDLNTLQTLYYDRNCLAFRYLNLHVSQLPLFACLIGNDIIPAEELRFFHQRLCQRNGRTSITEIASNLVSVINMERWIGDFNNMKELNSISRKVFGNTSWSRLICDGLKSYAIGCRMPSPRLSIALHPDVERMVYERHFQCLNPPVIFNILCNKEYESSEVLEDALWPPTALIYRKIRQRCYGVLFSCFLQIDHSYQSVDNNRRIVRIKEWCAYNGNNMENPESIEALPVKFQDYQSQCSSIEQLWFTFTEEEKLKLFCSIFQAPLDFQLLHILPKHHIVLCCILNYLIGESETHGILHPWEVAVFMAQALWEKDVEVLEKLQVPWVDSTAVHLATLFMRGVATAIMVLGTCGFPFDLQNAMPWRFFDGKLFHYLYVTSKERPNISQLCNNQPQHIKEFYRLLSVVTSNTMYATDRFKWNRVLIDFQEEQITQIS